MIQLARRSLAASVLVAAGALALAGCGGGAGSTPTVTETATVTATATETVTATPEPVAQAPGDPLTALEAWALCVAVSQVNDVTPQYWSPVAYSTDQVTDAGSGSFTVKPGFAQTGGGNGAQTTCTVSGSLGAPTVDYQGAVDFG